MTAQGEDAELPAHPQPILTSMAMSRDLLETVDQGVVKERDEDWVAPLLEHRYKGHHGISPRVGSLLQAPKVRGRAVGGIRRRA